MLSLLIVVLWKTDHLHRDCSGGRIFGICFLLMIQNKWTESLFLSGVHSVALVTIHEPCCPLCFMHSFPAFYIFVAKSCLPSFPQFIFVFLVTSFSLFCSPLPRKGKLALWLTLQSRSCHQHVSIHSAQEISGLMK